MEQMLGKFQSDLGNISSEIRALQEQSQSMSVRLRNRKAAEAKLGTFLDNLALPPALIDGILLAPPDAGFAVRTSSYMNYHKIDILNGVVRQLDRGEGLIQFSAQIA